MVAPHPDDGARRRRSAPRPLVLLLLVVAALGVAWTLVTPANQAPDEFAHIGYTQYFAETGKLPGKDPTAPPVSTEELGALDASNGLRAPGIPQVHLTWDRPAFDAWRTADGRAPGAARQDGGGPNPASSNPPLYYLTTAPAYLLGSGGDFFTRLWLVRLVSLLWLLGAVVGAWLLAGEVFRRDRLMQTTVAGVVGLAPMEQFIGTSANPDPAVFATWAFALWLGVRLLRRGLSPGRAGALFLVVGLACVVKATSYALVPAALVALAVAVWRVRRPSRRSVARAARRGRTTTTADATLADHAPTGTTPTEDDTTAVAGPQHDHPHDDADAPPAALPSPRRRVVASVVLAAAGLALTFGVWIVVSRATGTATAAQAAEVGRTPINAAQLFSYVWQFYLPKLPFMDAVLHAPALPAYDVLLKGAWGRFGWLEVVLPAWVYAVLAAITVVVGVLALAGAWRDRRGIDPAIVVFFVLVTAALMAGLHVTEFQKGGSGFIQGRYVLPLLPLGGLAVARALRWLPARRIAPVAGAALAGLLVLNVFGLALVLERFYA